MKAPRPRSYPASGSNPPAPIPESQARALDRKHALDDQQRNFQNSVPAPHFPRPRPPG